ncbi:hypothetical protein BN8_04186 [Fibrisoma limi BUZ 3]|uniref:Uncharacterized protein n=1 Tax=Fibrisoma limi BUZ 3 TaxID=1185876 RepID=I2GM36_9BACT|nr:hypothetical protein BN8_04186 [Fibrisoma limi BUZ 3]
MIYTGCRLFVLWTCIITGLLASATEGLGQDVMYFSNGDSLPNARPTAIAAGNVTFTHTRNGVARAYTFSRSRVLAAFNNKGSFLILSELPTDAAVASEQLSQYLSAVPPEPEHDYLVRGTSPAILPVRISHESDSSVNYLSPDNQVASVKKSELVAILYQDGRHSLIGPRADAIAVLTSLHSTLVKMQQGTLPMLATMPQDTVLIKAVKQIVPDRVTTFSQPTRSDTLGSVGAVPDSQTVEREKYRAQSIQRVNQFISYLDIITDRNRSDTEKDKAIEQVKALFLPGAMIEVTLARRPGVRSYLVAQYLNQIRLVPYFTYQLNWVETQFINGLKRAPDGTYYGIIVGQQTFTGYGKNEQVVHSDFMTKQVRVKLSDPSKTINRQDDDATEQVLLNKVSIDVKQN